MSFSSVISRAIPVPLISIAAASVGATYTLVGTFTLPIAILNTVSTLDQNVFISFDGIHDDFYAAAEGGYPISSPFNFLANNIVLGAPVNIYTRYDTEVPTTGVLIFSGFSFTLL